MDVFKLKEEIKSEKEDILSQFRSGDTNGRELTQNLSDLVDRRVTQLADHFFGDYKDQTALIFTGSNGRQEVCPESDMDIFVLVADETFNDGKFNQEFLESYSSLMLALTDVGLLKGVQTIRSLDECKQAILDDQTIWSSFIDNRLAWGSEELHNKTENFLNEIDHPVKLQFVREKLQERMTRLAKPGNFSNVLYPNIKEGYGGLRDTQTIQWIGHTIDECEDISDLVEKGIITSNESIELQDAYDYLLTVRSHLHDIVGREEDRLEAEYQEELAARMGYPDDIQGFMSHYLKSARAVGFIANASSSNIVEKNELEDDCLITGRMGNPICGINYMDASHAVGNPLEILKTYLKSLDEQTDLDPNSLRRIRNQREIFKKDLQQDSEINQVLGQIILHPKGSSAVLRQMQEIGILQKLLPEFAHADRLMQFDPYHSYTVDEHSLVAMDCIRAMESQELKDEAPLASELGKKISDSNRRIVTAALLLHDICKGKGGDHAKLGEVASFEFCKRFDMNEQETETVAWLVRNHLDMSKVAQRQDLEDFKTIEDFSRKVGSKQRLDLLTMLTTADIMAVGPDKWTPHNSFVIEELYIKSQLYIEGSKLAAEVPAHRLPSGYKEGEPFVGYEQNARNKTTRINVIAPKQNHLLENVSGALGASQCNILDARIKNITQKDDVIEMYSFTIQTSVGRQHEEDQLQRVIEAVKNVVNIEEKLLFPPNFSATRNMKRYMPFPIEPGIAFSNAVSENSTAVKITARDKPDLFHKLSLAFSSAGVDVNLAKITTQGHKAIDTFFIKDKDGQQISEEDFNEIAEFIEPIIAEL